MTDHSHTTIPDLAIESFIVLLRGAWNTVRELATATGQDPGTFLADWAQGNWETIVEAAVSPHGQIFLEPYGEGADCNPVGSRIWKAEAAPTHGIYCSPRSGTSARDQLTGEEAQFPQAGFLLDRFATRTAGGWYAEEPPFDYALTIHGGRERLFLLSEVRFALREVAAT